MNDLLHYEDFDIGRTFQFGRYEVTAEEIVEFAAEFDPQPHHLDDEAGKLTVLGGLAASGWHVCAMAMRMMVDGLVTKTASQGGAGVEECRWIKPVRPGDVLRLEVEVLEKSAPKSRPKIGFVKLAWRVFNQHGQVALIVTTFMPERRTG